MIRRIDLRGPAAPDDYRAAVPRAEFDVEAATPCRPPDLRRGPRPRGRRDHRVLPAVRRRRPVRHRCPALRHRRRAGRARPGRPGRARGVDPQAARHLRGRARARRRHRPRPRRDRHPPDGARRTGRALRPRRDRAPGLQRGDERRPRPGRRRRLDRAHVVAPARPRRAAAPDDPRRLRACSASTRCTPSAAPRRSPCSRTARDPAAGSTSSPARARSTPWPPSGCSRAWSASTPRRDRPRSPCSPTTPPTRRTSPPT